MHPALQILGGIRSNQRADLPHARAAFRLLPNAPVVSSGARFPSVAALHKGKHAI